MSKPATSPSDLAIPSSIPPSGHHRSASADGRWSSLPPCCSAAHLRPVDTLGHVPFPLLFLPRAICRPWRRARQGWRGNMHMVYGYDMHARRPFSIPRTLASAIQAQATLDGSSDIDRLQTHVSCRTDGGTIHIAYKKVVWNCLYPDKSPSLPFPIPRCSLKLCRHRLSLQETPPTLPYTLSIDAAHLYCMSWRNPIV